jgi:hypothetical protein
MTDTGMFPLAINCFNCEVMFLLLHTSGQTFSSTGQHLAFVHVLYVTAQATQLYFPTTKTSCSKGLLVLLMLLYFIFLTNFLSTSHMLRFQTQPHSYAFLPF